MTARRFLNLIRGFILENMDEDERLEFNASMNERSSDVEKRRSLVLLQGGEIA